MLLIVIAFISGFLTVLTPCVLPVLPIVLASGTDKTQSKRVNGTIIGIIFSFSISALLLTSIVTALDISATTLRNFSTIILVLLGIAIIFPVWDKIQSKIEVLFRKNTQVKGEGFFAGFITGISLGIVWTPCVGPIVATVSTLASVNKISLISVLVVISYSIGLGIPLWYIAKKGGQAIQSLSTFKNNPNAVKKTFGFILLLTALFIYFDLDKDLQAWLIDNLPEFWTQIATNIESSFNVEQKLEVLK